MQTTILMMLLAYYTEKPLRFMLFPLFFQNQINRLVSWWKKNIRLLKKFSNLGLAKQSVLGGAKVSDKIIMIENFSRKCSDILIGGAMAYTFLAAKGIAVGKSRIEKDKIQVAKDVIAICKKRGVNLHLPIDHIGAEKFAEDSEPVETEALSNEVMGLDIGPETLNTLLSSKKLPAFLEWTNGCIWWEHFSSGTKGVANALAECDGYTVVGGGCCSRCCSF